MNEDLLLNVKKIFSFLYIEKNIYIYNSRSPTYKSTWTLQEDTFTENGISFITDRTISISFNRFSN